MAEAEQDNSQAGIVGWDGQAVPPPPRTQLSLERMLRTPYICAHVHAHTACTSRVGAGAGSPWETQFLGEGNHELLLPAPTSLEDWPGSLTGKRAVHSLRSQGPADAAPTLRPAPAPAPRTLHSGPVSPDLLCSWHDARRGCDDLILSPPAP